MRTYRNLFNQILPPLAVCRNALDAAQGKLSRPDVLDAFVHFDDTYVNIMKCVMDPNYKPCEDNQHVIIDGANHKAREIEKPKFNPEQILHHMLIEPFIPIVMNGLYEQVYGCLPAIKVKCKGGVMKTKKFGPHAAVRKLRKWVQNDKKTYVAELDIHHAYGSVHIGTLVRQLRRVIKDEEWMRMACEFLHYDENDPEKENKFGLTLGHYTSPWLFNFYLKQFDHFAAQIEGIKYLRFADNLFLVGPNKRKLHRAVEAIKEYLASELNLEINSSEQVYRLEYSNRYGKIVGRAVNALGAVIHYNRLTLRKSILMRMRRKAIRVGAKKSKSTWHDGASMFSRLSWIRWTDTFTYYTEHVKPRINTRMLKSKVREHTKRVMLLIEERRRIVNEGLENSTRLVARKAAGF